MSKKYRIKSKMRFTLFLTIMLLIVFTAVGTAFGAYNAESLTKTSYLEIEIQTGDNLWNLAKEFVPKNNYTREIIHRICMLNGITPECIYPGQTLLIPINI
jgi:hypothetical protein